jgi:hypothetical protein
MFTLSRHLSPDDRRLHLVSLFQSVYWNLLLFLYDCHAITYRLFGTRFLMLPHQASQNGTPASLGTFSDCPIVLYHGQAGLESALLSVGWSCRLHFVVALVHPAAERILPTAFIVSFIPFFQSVSGRWTLPKVRLFAWRPIGPRLALSVRLDHSLTILDTLSSF